MSSHVEFLKALKEAGEEYIKSPLVRFKDKFKQCSDSSKKLAFALSTLNPHDVEDMPRAVDSILTFIREKRTDKKVSSFWAEYLLPKIVSFEANPVCSLAGQVGEQLQTLANAFKQDTRATKFVKRASCFIFSCLRDTVPVVVDIEKQQITPELW